MPDSVERQVKSDHSARNAYLAVGPCGCGYGIDTEDNDDARRNVAGWSAEGATVEWLPLEEAKARVNPHCPHEPRYGLVDPVAERDRLRERVAELEAASPLGSLHEDSAEIRRLRAENENLAAWATHWRECNARNVKDIDHHRAGIRWAQGMCSDGEPVEAISAHLTKVLSTMPGDESPLPADEEKAT